jgi:hypothetical protein
VHYDATILKIICFDFIDLVEGQIITFELLTLELVIQFLVIFVQFNSIYLQFILLFVK